jgi:uncharacterized protein YuzE
MRISYDRFVDGAHLFLIDDIPHGRNRAHECDWDTVGGTIRVASTPEGKVFAFEILPASHFLPQAMLKHGHSRIESGVKFDYQLETDMGTIVFQSDITENEVAKKVRCDPIPLIMHFDREGKLIRIQIKQATKYLFLERMTNTDCLSN